MSDKNALALLLVLAGFATFHELRRHALTEDVGSYLSS
jgi:hypothetical protein